jgi:surface antigen
MQQTGILFYRFQFLIAGITVLVFLTLVSALVTAVGSHSILDSRTGSSASSISVTPPDTPNAVANATYILIGGTQRALLSTGIAFYSTCRSITGTATHTGKAIAHGGAVVVHGIGSGIAFTGRGIWHGIAFTGRSIGNGVMFTVHLPGKLIHPFTSGHAVASIIRPSEDDTLPVIDSETSEAVLAQLNAQQRQIISDQLAAQAAANRGLGGTILAGDPNHGGYPTKWDAPVRQDSLLDSWGMYNRECVSYAAWKVYQTYGHMPYWGGVGNANQWIRDARRAGIPTGTTPQVHSVAISMRGYYGHAMWVEKVSGDMIYVSQYNYDLRGHYSEMWVNASSFTYIYFR